MIQEYIFLYFRYNSSKKRRFTVCTAVSFLTKDHYFGRNLDYEHSFGEKIIVTPRYYPLKFKFEKSLYEHYALIGIGIIEDDYPLYFDASNEKGLSFAGLNFPNNAHYDDFKEKFINLTPYELPLFILGKCSTVKEVKEILLKANIVNIPFSDKYSLSPLHFMFSDREESVVFETTKDGIFLYDNRTGVLTNNPAFLMQMQNLNNFIGISNMEPENLFSDKLKFDIYSRGMGGLGLPGDLSSSSRFVRAVFTKLNSVCDYDEESSVSQFFHILYSVYQQKGCVCLSDGVYEKTNYTSCCNTDKGIYYYTTYNNQRITKIDMHKENLMQKSLISYELNKKQDILSGN